MHSIGCSLAVNNGDSSSRYSKAPWYYFLTSLTRERCLTPKVNTNFDPVLPNHGQGAEEEWSNSVFFSTSVHFSQRRVTRVINSFKCQ